MQFTDIINKILAILAPQERRQLYALVLVMVLMGALEVAGIGSILPFIAAIANIDTLLEHRYAHQLYTFMGFDNTRQFVIFLGALVLTLLIARNVFFALANWLVSRFSFSWRQHLSEQLLRRYLNQPYSYFLSHNSDDLKHKVSVEMERLIGRVIIPGIQAFTSALITLSIVILLVALDPLVALVVAAAMGGSYLLLYGLVYKKLGRISKRANSARRLQFKIASEALEGVKELKLFGKEERFLSGYSAWSRENARLETFNRTLSQIPKHGIELLAVSGIMLFILYLVGTRRELAQWLPILVVYVVAGYRMLPALQKIFSGVTAMQYDRPTLDALYADFTALSVEDSARRPRGDAQEPSAFRPLERIVMRDLTYRYPQASDEAIRRLDLCIEKNTTVGLVGPTGSGKTTLIDIILGLLQPQDGQLLVNDIPIGAHNVTAWQQHVGYVPQEIFLFDDTVTRNIAFGVPDEEIDQAALERALRTVDLYDYVTQALPEGAQTMLGQRGIRLSGGQKQRIGIARALYRNPDILVLDEATSALDGMTEGVVMEAIQKLSHKLTIIMIAHRLNTVKDCDVIHYIDRGTVVSSGSYEELTRSCIHFRKLANR